MLDRPERPPALAGARTEGAPAPAVANVVPEIDFAPAGTDGSDPVGRLKELMKSRKDESLQILSGWIEKREDAV